MHEVAEGRSSSRDPVQGAVFGYPEGLGSGNQPFSGVAAMSEAVRKIEERGSNEAGVHASAKGCPLHYPQYGG